jgi:hypothetical protein
MKRLGAIVLAAALAGCGASATQNWRTGPDVASPAVTIKGTQGAWGHVIVTINDEPVLDGQVSVWTGNGELTGTYQGKPMTGKCKKGRGGSVRTQCAITLDGQKVTTLYFRVK